LWCTISYVVMMLLLTAMERQQSPTIHQLEPTAHSYGTPKGPSSSYGAPQGPSSSYGAPSSSYDAPSNLYGALKITSRLSRLNLLISIKLKLGSKHYEDDG
ncbi:hypothetical protein L9F63_025314, partial [Diploptera punctata]